MKAEALMIKKELFLFFKRTEESTMAGREIEAISGKGLER